MNKDDVPHVLGFFTGAVQVHRIAALLSPHTQLPAAGQEPPIVGLFLTNSAYYVASVLAALSLGCAWLRRREGGEGR
jgi:hypothetical protein